MQIINLGLLAHVDAGKTTTVEQMLFHSGKLRTLGSVDKGDTQTDFLAIERERGISVTSASVEIDAGDVQIRIIDTPGHMDFSGEEKGTYKNFGFKDNYPNNNGVTLILGGTGNNKTKNIGYYHEGAFGFVKGDMVIFFDNNWIGDNTRNIGSMFQTALMTGVDVYKGEGTSRLMSSLEMSWTGWVSHANLVEASATNLP